MCSLAGRHDYERRLPQVRVCPYLPQQFVTANLNHVLVRNYQAVAAFSQAKKCLPTAACGVYITKAELAQHTSYNIDD